MDCPRCGFNQPRDRFCANCGLNVEVALAQKPPLWRRVSSSPSFYLTLTGILVALLVVFVITTRVPALLRATRGAPVSSREAGDPKLAAIADDATPPANEPDEPEANVAVEPTPPPAPVVTAAVAASTAPEYKRFETEFYELGHDQTAALIAGGERVGEDTGGRAYLIHDAAKLTEVFRTGARSLGPGFRDPLRTDGPQLIATPPTASEGLRYDLMLQLTKFENNRAAFRFSSALAMTPPRNRRRTPGRPKLQTRDRNHPGRHLRTRRHGRPTDRDRSPQPPPPPRIHDQSRPRPLEHLRLPQLRRRRNRMGRDGAAEVTGARIANQGKGRDRKWKWPSHLHQSKLGE